MRYLFKKIELKHKNVRRKTIFFCHVCEKVYHYVRKFIIIIDEYTKIKL